MSGCQYASARKGEVSMVLRNLRLACAVDSDANNELTCTILQIQRYRSKIWSPFLLFSKNNLKQLFGKPKM